MLQNQYFNHKLTKGHIEKILTNYNIKYNTMKNEIDAKFNSMIKLFVNDIRAFLENMEEITNERKKLKEVENNQIEISILKAKLEEKSLNENKMKNEIDILTKENSSLKIKIKKELKRTKSKRKKNLNTTFSSSIVNTESRPAKIKFMKIFKDSRGRSKDKKIINKNKFKTEGNKTTKNSQSKYNHLSISMEKRNLENLKTASNKPKENHSNSTEKIVVNSYKFKKINNNANNKKIKNDNKQNILFQKTPKNKSMIVNRTATICKRSINSKKDNNNENEQKSNNEEILSFVQTSEEEEPSLSVDDFIEEEIKELEMEEENILLLMNQIRNLKDDVEKKKKLV